MSDDRFLDIETKLAYQEDLVASLNQIVSAQQRKLDELEAAYRKLVDRVVEQSEELAALRIEDARRRTIKGRRAVSRWRGRWVC